MEKPALSQVVPSEQSTEQRVGAVASDPEPSEGTTETVTSLQDSSVTLKEPLDLESIRTEIRAWARDMLTNDPDVMSAHYALLVDRYFLSKNVTRDAVRQSMADWIQQGNRSLAFDVSDITITIERNRKASVRLVKTASVATVHGDTNLTTRSQLGMSLEGGRWKIISNRDFN